MTEKSAKLNCNLVGGVKGVAAYVFAGVTTIVFICFMRCVLCRNFRKNGKPVDQKSFVKPSCVNVKGTPIGEWPVHEVTHV